MTAKFETKIEKLTVKSFLSRNEMGQFAANEIADKMRELLSVQSEIRMIFAAAPSQNEVLDSLLNETDIDWQRVVAFHMDEYIGLPAGAPQGFGNFLKKHLFDKVQFKKVNIMDTQTENPQNECKRYGNLLREVPIDIVCMGIGENGHIAFNDPPVADFNDKHLVKIVELENACRQQQVNDGCFTNIGDVPTTALTLTVPTLMSGESLFCVVPSKTKAKAVYETLNGPIDERCPASILRRHDSAVLYLDQESSSLLIREY
jgi:glucosamine-6-phosphate deaminase